MIYFFYFLITVTVYLTMEMVTWFVHKYVMHGFLWYLHEDHHQPRYQHVFEKNDTFFVHLKKPYKYCLVHLHFCFLH